MTRTAIRLLMTLALATGGATMATAQAVPSVAVPGGGDSSKISSANRENNAEYNKLVGAGDGISKTVDQPRKHSAAVAATTADIKAGAPLRDIKGTPIGTILSVDASQAVVDTGKTKIGVPLTAFGKDDRGLLLGMTAGKFNELVAKAEASR